MKRCITQLLILACFFPLACSGEIACKMCGGWGHGSSYGRMFNPDSIQTVSGKVIAVNKIAPMDTEDYGISLFVDTGSEEIFAHLGPSWFLDTEPMQFQTGDNIEVTGSRITMDGDPVIVVTEIRKGNEKMALRSPKGQPVWSGWKKG